MNKLKKKYCSFKKKILKIVVFAKKRSKIARFLHVFLYEHELPEFLEFLNTFSM
jgi:hypothetical protein